MAANYTRQIEFKVNDRAIRQSTDRIVKSLTGIEKKLDVISKAFDKASASTKKTSTALNAWEKGIIAFSKPLVKTVKDFGKLETSIKLSAKALSELTRGKGLTGLQSLLSEASKAQSLLLTTNAGYVNALRATLKLEGDINFELIARQRILDDLNRRQGITAGPGISGLRKSLSEQQAILDRMLAKNEGYLNQAKRVKDIEKLITQEMKERERIMGKLVTKQEFLAKMGRGAGKVAGRAAQGLRPGRGIEARGLGLAGLGVSGVGIHSGQLAAGMSAGINPVAMGVKGVANAMGLGAIKGASFLGVLNAIGAAAMAHPQLIGVYATALMIWGNRVNEIAVGPIKLFHKGLWGLGKVLAETHRPVDKLKKGFKSLSRESLEPVRMELNLSAAAAKQFQVSLDGLAQARERLRQTRIEAGHMKGSGFGAWSAAVDQQKKTGSDFADPTRRETLKWANALDAANNRTVEIKGKHLNIEQRINMVLERRRRLANEANKQGIFKGGAGGAISSAMIGGGFPLLFGQGGASAVGGGIGGLVGGAIGGGFGFGLSIVGTAIGQWISQMDEFNAQVNAVNADMKALGFSSEFVGKEIKDMAKYLRISKEETMQLFSNYMRFGKEAGTTLMKFYGKDFSQLFSIGKIKDSASAIQAIVSMSSVLTFEDQARLIAKVKMVSVEQMQVELMDLMIERQLIKRRELLEEISLQSQVFYWTRRIGIEMMKRVNPLMRVTSGVPDAGESPAEKSARLIKELEEGMENVKKATKEALAEIGSVEDVLTGVTGELSKIDSLYKQIGGTIEDGIVNAIEGAIKGTKTLGDVLNSVFNQLASQFLRFGVNQLLGSIPGIGKAFKADGGPVSGGSPYIVGEKGPELFVPNSSGNIVPNHAMGGSMIVNVDASGSSVEGDDDRSRQLGELIGAAVQSEIIRQQRPGGTLY